MENPDMDGSLWSRLPEDLIERVLVRLPAASLLRLRTVCRRWSEIVATKSFLEDCSQVVSYEPYFVKMSSRNYSRSLLSFDPCTNRWRNVPTSYLPSKVGYPMSSSGGLICFINNMQASVRDGTVLFVSNPLTKTWKELPRFPCLKRCEMLVSMIMWKRPSHYKVIVVGVGTTKIFDSVEGHWRNTGCQPCGEEVGLRSMAFCNGSLYCLRQHSSITCSLQAFSIQDEVWSTVKTKRLPGHRQFRNLVTCKGHILIVSKAVREKVLLVCVWLLDWKTRKWLEKGRMSDRVLGRPSESFHCCSHGDMIFLTEDKWHMKGLLFDLPQNMWRWVDASPNLVDGFSGVASFEPRLDSHV